MAVSEQVKILCVKLGISVSELAHAYMDSKSSSI